MKLLAWAQRICEGADVDAAARGGRGMAGPSHVSAAERRCRPLWGPQNVGPGRCGGRKMVGPGAVGAAERRCRPLWGPGAVGAGKREGGVAGAAGCGCRGVWGRGDVGAWKMLVPEMLRQQIILNLVL